MIKVDLHTHSEASKDGGISPEQYATLLRDEVLDVIAITDHDRIDFALGMAKALGNDRIIVGEEISTTDGELIGLYLTEKIEPGLSAQTTIDAIKAQNGIVYVPHPFEKVRHGIQKEVLEAIITDIDIIEGYNGRALMQNFSADAIATAKTHGVVTASSSDAHVVGGTGRTYTSLKKRPTRGNLVQELAQSYMVCGKPPLYTLLFPKINRFLHLISGRK